MLQFSYYNLVFTLIAIAMIFPYYLLSGNADSSQSPIIYLVLALSELVLFLYIEKTRKKITSQSLALFWQFIALAILTRAIVNLLTLFSNGAIPLLTSDFFSLTTYFFILLAIETTPHSSNIPLSKYIKGRIPAIFFIVTCFCYFVLLPYEFANERYESGIPSAYFHMAICTLVVIRLISHLLSSQDRGWQRFYGLIATGAISLFVNNLNTFMVYYNQSSLAAYVISILNFVPLFVGLLSLRIAPKLVTQQNDNNKHYQIETYIYGLTVSLVAIHLIGIEYSLIYSVPNLFQPMTILLWCLSTLYLIASIAKSKRNRHYVIKSDNKRLSKDIHELNLQNTQLQTSLYNSEEKAIVASSNNAILTVSPEGKILSVNPAAVHLFQRLEQEFIGSDINSLFDVNETMHHFFNFKSNVFSLQRQEKGISIESTALRSDGEQFPVQVALQWTERNEHPLVVITFVNLTERKLAEKQALDLKDKFIANISHEFRTPLTIINGILDRYLTIATENSQIKELNTAKRNGLRLVRMVEQLLELSKLTDNPSLSISRHRLATLMNMPIDSFKKLAEQHELKFEANVPNNLWLDCDPQAFEKVIFNLLANAVKYTPAGGSIEVNVYLENDTINLAVIDTGIGIKQASKDLIFQRFQRADDDKNKSILV